MLANTRCPAFAGFLAFAVGLGCLMPVGATAAEPSRPDRPNILWLTAEDMSLLVG